MKEDEVVKKPIKNGEKNVEKKKENTVSNTKKTSDKKVEPKNIAAKKETTKKTTTEKTTKVKTTVAKTTATAKSSSGTAAKKTNTKDAKSTATKKPASTVAKKKEDNLADIFESSSKELNKKQSSGTKKATTSSKTSSSKASTVKKNNTATGTKSKVEASKNNTAKKKITDKTSSEKSSTIKIKAKDKENKKNENTKKNKVEDIKNDEKVEKEQAEKDIDMDVIGKELLNKTTIPQDDFVKLIKDSAASIIYFVGVLIFLIFDLIIFKKVSIDVFIRIQNVFSFVFLGASITFFELAYRKEDTPRCIIGIEALLIGIFTLTIPYAYQIFKDTFSKYILSALVIILGYYIVKLCIVLYRKQSRYFRLQENFTYEEVDNEFNIDDDDDE